MIYLRCKEVCDATAFYLVRSGDWSGVRFDSSSAPGPSCPPPHSGVIRPYSRSSLDAGTVLRGIACKASPGVYDDCPRNDTGINWAGGCDSYNEYELGFDDGGGYEDEGPLDLITGCSGGHDTCPDCEYVNQTVINPPSPVYQTDPFDEEVYWSYYNVDHTTSFCSGSCWTDTNSVEYGGIYGYFPYTCVD